MTVTLGLKMEEYHQMPYEVAWSLASFSNHTCNYYPQLEPSEDEAAPWPGKLKGAETHPSKSGSSSVRTLRRRLHGLVSLPWYLGHRAVDGVLF